MQADIGIDRELLVGYHEAVEVGTDNVAERPGCQSEGQLAVADLAVLHYLDEFLQLHLRLVLLLAFPLGRVGIHKGQANIAFGHDERLAALQFNAFFPQLLG